MKNPKRRLHGSSDYIATFDSPRVPSGPDRGAPLKLNKCGARISVVEVIFNEEKNSNKIEEILHIDGRDPIVAAGAGHDFNEALGQVNDRLKRQLRKLQEQVTDHRAPSRAEALFQE
ncbi:MAG TPA: hypothetical protein DCS76_06040 [Gemmatimonadetes bacterium]|nr:hypothetical protein [Gemmatimonadota bacterium]